MNQCLHNISGSHGVHIQICSILRFSWSILLKCCVHLWMSFSKTQTLPQEYIPPILTSSRLHLTFVTVCLVYVIRNNSVDQSAFLTGFRTDFTSSVWNFHYWCYVWVSYNLRKYGEHMFRENSLLHLSYKLYVLCVQTKDNNNSPHGKFHRFLFPFSSKFPDLNFAPYVLYIYSCYMKPVRDTNSEPSLPVAKRPQRRIASWTAVFVAGWNRGKLPTVSCFVTQSTFRQND